MIKRRIIQMITNPSLKGVETMAFFLWEIHSHFLSKHQQTKMNSSTGSVGINLHCGQTSLLTSNVQSGKSTNAPE